MAEIFLSYARTDAQQVDVIKRALEALGLSVFLDTSDFQTGESFPDVLAREIEAAGAVVSCWNTHALTREWVKIECDAAREQGKLFPIEIGEISDDVLTVTYSKLHRSDLKGFTGDQDHTGWRELIRSLERRLGKPDLLKLAAKRAAADEAERLRVAKLEKQNANLQKRKGGLRLWQWGIAAVVAISLGLGGLFYSEHLTRERMLGAAMTDELRAAMSLVDVERELDARQILSGVIDEASLGQLMQVSAFDGASATMAGWAYKFGLGGVAENKTEAARLFQTACDTGFARGCRNLGLMLSLGDGVDTDHARARTLYEAACTAGDMRGCNNLGVQAVYGDGTEIDFTDADARFRQACDGGDPRGCTNLGNLILGLWPTQTRPATPDHGAANALFTTACEGGDAVACNALGSQYLNGNDVPQDIARAIALFEQACAGGSDAACDNAAAVSAATP
ncbi:MAG: toll/interleukin-1 receptor domain-containing protein [Pseudomonadota bacterium]